MAKRSHEYKFSSMSSPDSANIPDSCIDPASVYYARQLELEMLLTDFEDGMGRSTPNFSDVKDSIFRAVSFGQKRGEIFIFTDDPLGPNASETIRLVHDAIPESQRFYYLPKIMTKIECELELHSMCVRVVEVVEEQSSIECFGSGSRFHDHLFEGVDLRVNKDGSQTATVDLVCIDEPQSFLKPLHDLTKASKDREALEEVRAREAELSKGRQDAIDRGLQFDVGPCPF